MRTFRPSAPLSATKEDYLRAIYLLGQHAPVGVTEVAKRLQLSKSTVSERIKDLVKDGLVEASPYSSIGLTSAGTLAAEILTYKHRLIEVFLHQTLGMPKSHVHAEAERLEHAISDVVIKKLAIFLDHPTTDPHGTLIPKIAQWSNTKSIKK